MLRLIEIAKPDGGVVLDVATGAGHVAFAFAPYVDAVVAYDSSPGMLELAAREAARRGLANFETKLGDAHELPFANETFDGVTTRSAPHHFYSIPRFLGELFRVLKPGAWVLIADTVGSEDSGADELIQQLEKTRDATHVRSVTVSAWTQLIESAGFQHLRVESKPKRLNAKEWLTRQDLSEEVRSKVTQMLFHPNPKFQEYVNPTRENGELFLHLHEGTFFFRKPALP